MTALPLIEPATAIGPAADLPTAVQKSVLADVETDFPVVNA